MTDETEVVLSVIRETDVVVIPTTQVVSHVVREPTIISDTETNSVAIDFKETFLVSLGGQGPAGTPGVNGGVFVLDVSPTTTGIVGDKTYDEGVVPVGFVLETCRTDTPNVRLKVGSSGGAVKYSPTIYANGVAVTLSETSTKRWFEGYVDLVLAYGDNIVNITTDEGAKASVSVFVAGAGPDVLTCVFGSYPGIQTELKAGDVISASVTTEIDAVSVVVLAGDASGGTTEWPVTNGSANVSITASSGSGSLPVRFKARNALGTLGAEFVSSALVLNQTHPTITVPVLSYPPGKAALDTGDVVTVSATVTNFDTVSYTSTVTSVANPNTYEADKTCTNTYSGYVGGGTNYTITANRAANNATTTAGASIKIATVPPTATITTSPAGRMASSPTGLTYAVRVTPNQTLAAAPTLTASHGTWSGSWSWSGSYWTRNLVISDADPRGTASFSGLSMTGLSNLVGTTIVSGATYVVGGFSTRYITFPAFSRVAPLGVNVADQTKVTASIVGGAALTRYSDNLERQGGFYVADADGSYNPTGAYIGLSDSVFAASNTSGTLQAIATEAA